MSNRNAQLDQYIQENLDRYIQETKRICAQPSVSATGQGVRECSETRRRTHR